MRQGQRSTGRFWGGSEMAKRIAAEVCDELDLWTSFLTNTEAINRIASIVERVGNADA